VYFVSSTLIPMIRCEIPVVLVDAAPRNRYLVSPNAEHDRSQLLQWYLPVPPTYPRGELPLQVRGCAPASTTSQGRTPAPGERLRTGLNNYTTQKHNADNTQRAKAHGHDAPSSKRVFFVSSDVVLSDMTKLQTLFTKQENRTTPAGRIQDENKMGGPHIGRVRIRHSSLWTRPPGPVGTTYRIPPVASILSQGNVPSTVPILQSARSKTLSPCFSDSSTRCRRDSSASG
jgi:hypothetical protein